MTEIFGSVKFLLKPKTENEYNFTFNLHTKYTVVLLVSCSLLLTAQFAREPISCLSGDAAVPDYLMNTFCWVNGTFVIADNLNRNFIGLRTISAGIGSDDYDKPRIFQYHYQWLTIMLILQATLFYMPRYLWKVWEGKTLMSLLHNPQQTGHQQLQQPNQHQLNTNSGRRSEVKVEEDARNSSSSRKPKSHHQMRLLFRFFKKNSHRRISYVTKYTICEFLNVCNVFGQLSVVNYYFDNGFQTFGYDVLQYWMNASEQWQYYSPMDQLFPKMAKCIFHKFGPSGSIEVIDGLCVLSWNMMFEKIYFIMWWWFVVLACFTFVNTFARLLTVFSRTFRYYMLKDAAILTRPMVLKEIIAKTDFSDVFVLCKIAKNVQAAEFDKILEELYEIL